MKVTKVEVFHCHVVRKDPKTKGNSPIIIRVHTDEGYTGLGEAGLAYGTGGEAAVGMIKDLAKFVIGMDPLNTEALWETMFRNTFWGMGGGPVIYAGMSAYDIACWDIKGKKFGVPCHVLLGGRTRQDLRAYASQIHYGWSDRQIFTTKAEDYGKNALDAVADGFDCVKVDPMTIGYDGSTAHASRGGKGSGAREHWFGLLRNADVEMGASRIRAIREAVGPDVDIICEVHAMLGTNAAIQFAHAIEKYNILYYEEPTMPMNPKNFAKIARSTTIPIATGERSYTRWGFRELLESQSLAVVQPDLCLVGGLTEGKKICDMAHVYDASVQIHVCGGPVATATAIQLEATIPNFIIHEHHQNNRREVMREICKYDYQPKNGRFAIPELPGIGQELNDDVCKDYLVAVLE